MANISNLESFLTDVANAIRRKKSMDEPILAANFDAAIDSIATGTVLDTVTVDAKEIVEDTDIVKVISTPVSKPIVIPENGITEVIADKNTLASSIGLSSDKIITGESVLGIEGTAEIGESTGDVKLFETIEEMQADENPTEGDLAVVYRSDVQSVKEDSKFNTAIFPSVVVLPEAITDYVNITYRSLDTSIMFDCWGQLDRSFFNMDCYTETGGIRIMYESSDGITYTRISLEGDSVNGDTVDFGTTLYYSGSQWNDVIGYFIQIPNMYFGGLYKYETHYKNADYIQVPLADSIVVTPNAEAFYEYDVAWDGRHCDIKLPKDKLISLMSKIYSEIINSYYPYSCFYIDPNGDLYSLWAKSSVDGSFDTSRLGMAFTSTGDVFGVARNDGHNKEYVLLVYKCDLENCTYTLEKEITGQRIGTSNLHYPLDMQSTAFYVELENQTAPVFSSPGSMYIDNGTTSKTPPLNDDAYHDLSVYEDLYVLARTQLTATIDKILPDEIAYGENGIIIGDGSIWDNISNFDVLNGKITDFASNHTLVHCNKNLTYIGDIIPDGTVCYAYKKFNKPAELNEYEVYSIQNGTKYIAWHDNLREIRLYDLDFTLLDSKTIGTNNTISIAKQHFAINTNNLVVADGEYYVYWYKITDTLEEHKIQIPKNVYTISSWYVKNNVLYFVVQYSNQIHVFSYNGNTATELYTSNTLTYSYMHSARFCDNGDALYCSIVHNYSSNFLNLVLKITSPTVCSTYYTGAAMKDFRVLTDNGYAMGMSGIYSISDLSTIISTRTSGSLTGQYSGKDYIPIAHYIPNEDLLVEKDYRYFGVNKRSDNFGDGIRTIIDGINSTSVSWSMCTMIDDYHMRNICNVPMADGTFETYFVDGYLNKGENPNGNSVINLINAENDNLYLMCTNTLDNGLSANEYNTAIDTTEEILGI